MNDDREPTPDAAAETPPPAPPIETPADVPPPSDGSPARRPFFTRTRVIVMSSVGLVVVLVLSGFLYLARPVEGSAFHDPVDAESRSVNTALYATLLAAGINDPFVDVNQDRAYVVYVLPNTTGASPANITLYQRFVIGAAADAAPHVERIFTMLYVGAKPNGLWSVAMSDVRDYLRGTLDAAAFDARITKTQY